MKLLAAAAAAALVGWLITPWVAWSLRVRRQRRRSR